MAVNGMTVVDAHVHLLPGRLGEKVRAFFDAGVGTHTPLAYPNNHERVVDTLYSEGVDVLWSLPYAHKPGVAQGLNEASASTVKQFAHSPLRIVGGATVHPGDIDPVGTVRTAVDEFGLRVLKLHCSVGAFSVEDERLSVVYSFAAERRLPVVVHLGHHVNGKTDADELPAISRVADAFPAMPLILAHCGHHSAPDAIALMRSCESLYADLTPVVTEFPNIAPNDLREFSHRILFGSDSPNTAISVTKCLAWLRDMALPHQAMQAVLGENAMRLASQVVAE